MRTDRTITEVDPLLVGFFEEGEAFDGFYIFDPTVPPISLTESRATYPQNCHAISRELHVGDYSFVAERHRITVRNDSLSIAGDSYDLSGFTRMSPVIPEAIAATSVDVNLRDPDGNALSSTDLLEEAPALDDFETRELLILVTSFDCSSSSITCPAFLPLRGELTRLPEPRATVLAAAALLTLGARWRHKAQRMR